MIDLESYTRRQLLLDAGDYQQTHPANADPLIDGEFQSRFSG
jgi:hypothetical protein